MFAVHFMPSIRMLPLGGWRTGVGRLYAGSTGSSFVPQYSDFYFPFASVLPSGHLRFGDFTEFGLDGLQTGYSFNSIYSCYSRYSCS